MKITSLNLIILLAIQLKEVLTLGEIIYALNAGGDSHTDSFGIRYKRDQSSAGIASDYGRMVEIKRVWEGDKPVYETERYSMQTFAYNIPMPSGDADYVLWLKFCEVWFNGPNLKVKFISWSLFFF
jgi:hypothetical protein